MIKVFIDGNELRQSDKNGGVCGELNSTEMLFSFGEDWSGYDKKIVFWNALGANPVEILLFNPVVTADERTEYVIRIPAEPLEFEGKAEYMVEGNIVDEEVVSSRKKSVFGSLKVRYSPSSEGAEVPEEISATVAEQLQAEAERISEMANNMVPYIGDNGHWIVYNSETKEWEDTGVLAKGEKGDKGIPGNTPYIGEDGYWYVADMNMGVKAQGEKGEPGYTPQKGVDYFDGKDGSSPKISLHRDEINKTIQICAENGDGSFEYVYVHDGDKGDPGYTPKKGIDYFDGKNGKSPILMTSVLPDSVVTIIDGIHDAGGELDENGTAKTQLAGNESFRFIFLTGLTSVELVGKSIDYTVMIKNMDVYPAEYAVSLTLSASITVGLAYVNENELELTSINSEDVGGLGGYDFSITLPDEVPEGYSEGKLAVYADFQFSDYADGTISVSDISLSVDGAGNWYVWDDVLKKYVNSGVRAEGYIPVKGTDYWTEEDKEEIVADVLAALPDADKMSFPLEKTISEVSEDE